MKLGFIGTGAIAEAMVIGLAESGWPELSIILSPRNAETAAYLTERFPVLVTIAADNQSVVDASEVVVLSVRPPVLEEVTAPLAFDPRHLVLSLVATISMAEVARMVAPATRIVRAIPLPSAAQRASPTPILPPEPAIKALFDRLGVAVEVDEEAAFDALAAASGIMAGHFAVAATVSRWLEGKGVPAEASRDYVGRILLGLALTADRSSGTPFERLSDEHVTLGGLNEQFRSKLEAGGVHDVVRDGLDGLFTRIQGR